MIEKTPQGFVSRYAIPTPAEPVEQSIECTITPLAVETAKQAGGKGLDVDAYNSLVNAIIPILEADGVHSQLLLHSAMKIADLCQSAITAATAELQQERDYLHRTHCDILAAVNPLNFGGSTLAQVKAAVAATAELQAKCERLEGELAQAIALAYETRPGLGIPPLTWADAYQNACKSLYETQDSLKSAESQLAAKVEAVRNLPYPYALADNDHFRRIWALACDAASREIEKASPSPSRPSGEEVERQLQEHRRQFEGAPASDSLGEFFLRGFNEAAAEARRIMEGK